MLEVIRAANDIQFVCDDEEWRFCFIGGVALQRWGEPRETIDVYLTILTGFGNESRYIEVLIRHFRPRIHAAAEFALKNRVLLLEAVSGVGIDVALGGLRFEELAVERASPYTYPPGVTLRTCSAEDLVVMKAFSDRSRDWADLEGIILRQRDKLDRDYVYAQLAPLAELKESPELVNRLRALDRKLQT